MNPTCYLPLGDTRTPCGKHPGSVPHTNDASQATCPACYKALTDGYAKTRLMEVPLATEPIPRRVKLFDLDTVN